MGSNSTSDKNFVSTICIVQYNKNIQWHVHCTDCQYTGTSDKNCISTMHIVWYNKKYYTMACKNCISTMHIVWYNKKLLYNGMYTVHTVNTLVVVIKKL